LTAIDRLLAKLPDAKQIDKRWQARCPAHDDKTPSLSVASGNSGVLVKCHAGCEVSAIVLALGLTMRDLFDDEPATGRPKLGSIVCTYDYQRIDGSLAFQAVRYAKPAKTFRQRRPNGHGGWIWDLDGIEPLLYRLPQLQGQPELIVAEGEKDCDRLSSLGFVATTNPMGAGKWRASYTQQLVAAGVRTVCVLPDNDEPGAKHAEAAAASCHAAGLTVKVMLLPGLPPKGDVSDWLAQGHTGAELVGLLTEAQPWQPTAHTDAPTGSQAEASGIQLTALSELLGEPDETVDYLVQDRLPCGSVAILAGKPKTGKSTAARALALEVARGGSWLGFACLPRAVWYLVLEDKRSEVRRHFRAMGATGDEPVRFVFRQPTDQLIGQLHDLAAKEHPGLIVVDTLQRLIRAKDLNDYAETTAKLTPILTLARETGATVLLVHHAGKSTRKGIDAVLGSTALTGSVDNIFIVSRTDKFRLLSSIQRIGPDLPETVITLDPETGRITAGPTRHEADRGTVEAAIVAALQSTTLPQNEAELDAAVEGRTALKHEGLRALVRAGGVTRLGRGGKADPYRYAVLVPEAGNKQPDPVGVPDSSCFLVPSTSREQGNKNPLRREYPNNTGSGSCSLVPVSGWGQGGSGNQNPAVASPGATIPDMS
jgi:hypothetical protein